MRTQINNKKTKKIITAALYTMIIAGAAGAATGTYAWYSYQKNVSLDFKGASISNIGDEIEVGLRAPSALTTFEATYANDITLGQIVKETGVTVGSATEVVYWIKGSYIQNVLMDFVGELGYSTGTFSPITSGSWKDVDSHNTWGGFQKSPVVGGAADKDDYMKLPLAFKVRTTDDDPDTPATYEANKNIYLQKFAVTDITDNDDYDLSEAVRCKVDYPALGDDKSENFIFNPTSPDDEELAVGGILNLNRDAYYDYKYNAVTGKYEEIAYGEFKAATHGTATSSATPTIKVEDCSTFEANHLKDVLLVNEANAKVCETRKSAVAAVGTTDGELVKTIANGTEAKAFVDLSIYIEGWDHQVVDQTQENDFSISIEFAIE